MKHYTYRITHIPSSIHYYGTRSCGGDIHTDLGVKYFSSSSDKTFMQLQKRTPKDFKYKVIRIFDTREEAIEMEIYLHERFEVGINPSFFNKVKQTSVGFDCSGIPKSEDHRNKIRKAAKKRYENIPKALLCKFPALPKNTTVVYDKNGEEVFRCYGNFLVFCEKNGLPYSALRKSRATSERIFMFTAGQTWAKKRGFGEFIGWYASYENVT